MRAEAEVDRKLVEANEEMIRATEEAIADKERRYLDFVKKYNENLLGNLSDGQIKRTFEGFGHYKDAEAYAKKIVERMAEKEAKLKALQDEKREIINCFAKLGVFGGGKRKKLESRLSDINDEVERLQRESEQNG